MKAFCINLDTRPDRWEEFKTNKFPFETTRVPGILHKNRNIGCRASHIQILKKQTEFPFIIFEDDSILLEDWGIVENAMSQLPHDWDLLYLGASLKRPLEKFSENLFRLKGGWTTHAIIYGSKRVSDFIINNHNTAKVDEFFVTDVQEKFNCFITFPLVVTQSDSVSDIKPGRKNMGRILERYKRHTNDMPLL